MQVEIVKEIEIEAVEEMRAKGDFSVSLSRTQALLARLPEAGTRIRLLFNVICCSTQLERDDITRAASEELDTLPNPELSRMFANMIRANTDNDLGRYREAILLIDANLELPCMDRDDSRIHRLDHFAVKGRALARLRQWDDALVWLTKACSLYPDENAITDPETSQHVRWRTTSILCDSAVTLMGLRRFDEAYNTAKQILGRENGDFDVVALHYMAATRLNEGRYSEAMEIYQRLQAMLPSPLVDAAETRREMETCARELQKSGQHRQS